MRTLRAMAAFLVLTGGAIAQTETRLEFDVASIKPAVPDARGSIGHPIAGGVSLSNRTLKDLIVFAYRVQPFQISGGPPWIDSVRYDVTAKSEKTPKMTDQWLMLQALLADRFQLALHRETKQLPVYVLILARKNGKLGPSLIESNVDSCLEMDPTKPPPQPEPGQTPPRPCGMLRIFPGGLNGAGLAVRDITGLLSRLLGRIVTDQTGLTGEYDVTLEWTPDENLAAQGPLDAPKLPPSDPSGPSIFTALQEQLGLKLESQKGPVEILVIDRAAKPSEN